MITVQPPSPRPLRRGGTLFLMCLLPLLAASCATGRNDMTRGEIAFFDEHGYGIDHLRFYVSHDVKLIHRDEILDAPRTMTVLRDTLVRNEVLLKANTKGRLLYHTEGPEGSILHVAFERRDGKPLPLAFALQGLTPKDDDKYYFRYEHDPRTRERYIDYDDGRYEVHLEKGEEPHLVYAVKVRQKVTRRTMGGMR